MEILKTILSGIVGVGLTISSLLGFNQADVVQPVVETPSEETNFGAFSPTGGGTYRLKGSISSTDTSITLSSFKEPVSNTPYNMTLLGTTIGYGTLEPQVTGKSEFISFTGITQNSDGSAILTGVTRGLTRSPGASSCMASSTLALRHAAQSVFILSDSPCLFAEYAVKRNDETVQGYWNFPTPLTANNPATKAYVDSIVNGGAVSYDSIVVPGLAGETVATGTILFFDQYQDEWMKADADIASTSRNVILGIAQGSGTNGNPINDGILVRGLDLTNPSNGSDTGSFIYLSNTAGATSTSAGTLDVLLGMRRSATSLYFDPTLSDNRLNVASSTWYGTNSFISTTTVIRSKTVDESGVRIASKTELITTSQAWSKDSNARQLCITAIGSGAGGISGTGNPGGGGGGGGGISFGCFNAHLATSTVYITINSGGTAGNAGATTTVGTIISAPGGNAGSGGTGGTGGVYISTIHTPSGGFGLNGGTGGNGGTFSFTGGGAGGGGSAGGTSGTNGVNGVDGNPGDGGAGGVAPTNTSYLGNGGRGGDSNADNGTAGQSYGGGGGGGSGCSGGNCTPAGPFTAKSGASGVVVITTMY